MAHFNSDVSESLCGRKKQSRANNEPDEEAINLKALDALIAEHGHSPEAFLGKEGLLAQLTKALAERALGAELTYHLKTGRNPAQGGAEGAGYRNPSGVSSNLRTGLPGFQYHQCAHEHARCAHGERHLDAGEIAALALALERGIRNVLIDETAGCAAAIAFGLQPSGLLGLLVEAEERSPIPAVLPLLDQLRDNARFRVDADLRNRIAALSGEAP